MALAAADPRPRFRDRRAAGRALAGALTDLATERPIVVALPRGGVPVAYEVAQALGAPLDIGLVRKLGAPMQPEFGIGALGDEGAAVIDSEAVRRLGISREELGSVIDHERRELDRRRAAYRPGHPAMEVADRVVLLVDDGLATGVTAVAAARALRSRGARAVVLAVPVCPVDAKERLGREFDQIVCLSSPLPFLGVGASYEDFGQTTDAEVIDLLARAAGSPAQPRADESEVSIPAGVIRLPGTLRLPPAARGLVIFAHGSGSSRLSTRNHAVAAHLNQGGFATLLFDLLGEREARDRANVFDIELLAGRLLCACRWASGAPDVRDLPIGLFGASTGAAAALRAAAHAPAEIEAVVSRGGRPDLAEPFLDQVEAPTLLIVGGDDPEVLALNRGAATRLKADHELVVVPGAGHLFEEPGTMEEVQRLAEAWFAARLHTRRHGPVAEGSAR